MDLRPLIRARKEGRVHSAEELGQLARAAADPATPDEQLAAWLMAENWRELSREETAHLTLAMADSGERLDLTGLPKPWVDKHSTGGVGDKTTLVLLPLLAACGLTMVKMSGRGLGITGGTIDKLEAVPGFRVDLAPAAMVAQAREIGLSLSGQTPNLAPADKRLYAIRDVTETVDSIPLIVSSILSKKIAGGAEHIVLDVKCGSGAFMETRAEADELANWLEDVGARCGLNVRTLVTDMDQPLGRAVGNALEVQEALDVLRNRIDHPNVRRFRDLCLQLANHALETVGFAVNAERKLSSGDALHKARRWFAAQGADLDAFRLDLAPIVYEVRAEKSGRVARVDARRIGEIVVELGGGRKTKADVIDPRVGVTLEVQNGDTVREGDLLATIHASRAPVPDARDAFHII